MIDPIPQRHALSFRNGIFGSVTPGIMHLLSKSSYMRGRQCEKALFLLKNKRELATPPSVSLQAIFDQGSLVGDLACTRFPGGIDCSAEDHREYGAALENTKAALLTHDVIYEAAFQHEDVLAVMDILLRDGDGWKAIEVKSSTSVKQQFLEDAALQYHVITSTGLKLNSIHVMHIDNNYVRQGQIDVEQLFAMKDVTAEVLKKQADVRSTIEKLKAMLAAGIEPQREIGTHCDDPYECSFKEHCWKHLPVPSVFDLAYGKVKGHELFQQGIIRLDDVPDDIPLNPRQRKQIDVHRSGSPSIEPERIKRFLDQLKYPVFCLDFETFSSAIPPFPGTRPFQGIPFQYSIHMIDGLGNDPRHFEFIADASGDPRPELLDRLLIDLGDQGTILAYNLAFETGKLRELARWRPSASPAIEKLLSRCHDLAKPFQKQWYYDRGMNGRYSIKLVLPALVPEFSYADLEVSDGMMASTFFAQLISGSYTGDREQLRRNMLEYCKLDTLAMVKLLQVLERVAAE